MNNDTDITGNRFSNERTSSFFTNDEGVAFLDFTFEEEDIIVKISPNELARDAKIDILTSWVSNNLEAINDIGYEVLHKEDSVNTTVSNMGLTMIDVNDNEPEILKR